MTHENTTARRNAGEVVASSSGEAGRIPAPRAMAVFWIVAALVGWTVSFLLFLEYVGQLKNENPIVNCSFSAVVSCTPNLLSPGGNLLGFTNSIIGVTLFLGPLFAGVSVLAGGRMRLWYWRVFLGFITAAYLFVHMLAYRSIFEYGVLCPWCMVVWLVTIPLFWVTLGWAAKAGVLGSGRRLRRFGEVVLSWGWVIALINYLVIGLLAELQIQVIESLFL